MGNRGKIIRQFFAYLFPIIVIVAAAFLSWHIWMHCCNPVSHLKNTDSKKQGVAGDAIVATRNVIESTVAETVKDAVIFDEDSHTKEVTTLPAGQMLRAYKVKDGWVKVRLYNGGPIGYTKPENVIELVNRGGEGDFPLAEKANSTIDPRTDTVELLFNSKEPEHDGHNPEIEKIRKEIDFGEEARRFGITGDVGRPVGNDKGLLLPNGVYAVSDREYDNSSIFFLDLKKKTMVGIIHPTPPNWDMELCNDKLYVANGVYEQKVLTIIDYQKMKIVSSLNLGGPSTHLLCWQNEKLYAALPYGDEVAVINPRTDEKIKELKVGPAPRILEKCKEDKICVGNMGEFAPD